MMKRWVNLKAEKRSKGDSEFSHLKATAMLCVSLFALCVSKVSPGARYFASATLS